MVYIFLADGFEEIEAITPLDLLRRAGTKVSTVGINGKTVEGSHHLKIEADLLPEEVSLESAEMLILPGGVGHTLLGESSFVKDAIFYAAEHDIPITAICASPSLLGKWGLLQGKKATCFPGYEEMLKGATFLNVPVVTDGITTTSRGAGCSLLFGLELVRILHGEDVSREIGESIQL